ncbi:MAG: S-layer homology domain-containing protein [Oscillospiraceae bacterium]|jgi:uncharacterized repeat protein (TIGR02543 family)|nr:S-layer homology domain-containing protein [Oscillospiraceae bacterium]
MQVAKRITAVFLSFILALGLFAAMPTPAATAASEVADGVELKAALENGDSDVTITLTGNIVYSDEPITIDGSKIVTINVGGFTLSVTGATGPALTVESGGQLTINVGSGSFEVSSTTGNGVYAGSGAVVNITGNITTEGNGSTGVYAEAGADVTINGSVTNTGTVTGEVFDSFGVHAVGDGTEVDVTGGVSATGNLSIGVYAAEGADVVVAGGVEGTEYGVLALAGVSEESQADGATVTVNGGIVAISSPATRAIGVKAEGGAQVIVLSGGVKGSGCGVSAEDEDTYVKVTGDVTGGYTGEAVNTTSLGIRAEFGAEVYVIGDVYGGSDDDDGCVQSLYGASEVTIDGEIYPYSGCNYIYVSDVIKTKDEYELTSTKPYYREYQALDELYDALNYVWVHVEYTYPIPDPGPNYYTVAFETNGGSPVPPNQRVMYGSKATKPADPVKDDLTFAGWYTDEILTAAYDFDTPVRNNITLYAKYSERLRTPTLTDVHIKYLNGYEDGTVRPENDITRAEAAAIFFRLIADTDKSAPLSSAFSDLDVGSWYYQDVAYLQHNGIIKGYPDGTFRPNDPITRAEFAVIASRFDKLESNVPNTFSDVEDSYWAAGYINSAVAKGWITGYPDGTFKPKEYITRAEVVTLVNRMLDRRIHFEDLPESLEKYNDLDTDYWAYCDIIEASFGHEYERKPDGFETWLSWDN